MLTRSRRAAGLCVTLAALVTAAYALLSVSGCVLEEDEEDVGYPSSVTVGPDGGVVVEEYWTAAGGYRNSFWFSGTHAGK
jgi:hypothetical protein